MSVATQVDAVKSVEIPWGELEGIVGVKNVLRAKEDLIPYGFDGTAAMSQLPGCVVFVESTEQVAAKDHEETLTFLVAAGLELPRASPSTPILQFPAHKGPPQSQNKRKPLG